MKSSDKKLKTFKFLSIIVLILIGFSVFAAEFQSMSMRPLPRIELVLKRPMPGPVDLNPYVNGGAPPYKWRVAGGSLPKGIRLSEQGLVNGTPTRVGRYVVTIRATDSSKTPLSSLGPLSINVAVAPSESPQQTGGQIPGGQQPPGAPGAFQLPPGAPVTLTEIEAIINRIARVIIRLSVVILVISIIWSGMAYATAGNSQKRLEYAKNSLKYGVIGALVILGVGVILNTIGAFVTRLFFY